MSTLKTNTLSNVAGSSSTAIENAIHGSAKAWVNFDGTGTVAIRASYNVSSITDNGTGDYTVNFTTAMSDANYSAFVATGITAGTVADTFETQTFNTGSLKIRTSYLTGTTKAFNDYSLISVSIFR